MNLFIWLLFSLWYCSTRLALRWNNSFRTMCLVFFQTMIVPILEDLLKWTEFETSLFYCGAGIDVSVHTGHG